VGDATRGGRLVVRDSQPTGDRLLDLATSVLARVGVLLVAVDAASKVVPSDDRRVVKRRAKEIAGGASGQEALYGKPLKPSMQR
jgi:hypothetical protein